MTAVVTGAAASPHRDPPGLFDPEAGERSPDNLIDEFRRIARRKTGGDAMSNNRSNLRRARVLQPHGHLLAADPFGDAIVARAALNFIAAVAQSTAYLGELEQNPRDAFEAMRSGGIVIPPAFDDLPGVDARGRALHCPLPRGQWKNYLRLSPAHSPPCWRNRARPPRLRKRNQDVSERETRDEARSARNAFARALRAARQRDKAVSNG